MMQSLRETAGSSDNCRNVPSSADPWTMPIILAASPPIACYHLQPPSSFIVIQPENSLYHLGRRPGQPNVKTVLSMQCANVVLSLRMHKHTENVVTDHWWPENYNYYYT